tara:strand:+ start:1774 stop:2001 length:228 start_codon:yes stop_codon:yes gene_type:complete
MISKKTKVGRKIKYTRREQFTSCHNILEDIYNRHKDKRKLLSKQELDRIDVYLLTSKYTPKPKGMMVRTNVLRGR